MAITAKELACTSAGVALLIGACLKLAGITMLVMMTVHVLCTVEKLLTSSRPQAERIEAHDADMPAAKSPRVFIMSGADDDGDVADEDWGAEFNLTNSGCQVFALAADGDDSDDDNAAPKTFIIWEDSDDGDIADEESWGESIDLATSGCQVFALAAGGDDSDGDNVSTAASSGSDGH
eukprot:TRINITY_DN13594_c0_g1_i4.p2 TRINITY_DN13594_c0_g1~~TRINITY_DN13594_c0_g1_i4.p2  ORF type:complete len:178 (+),score=45.14 TRINITY_DN13594_c0_g1_i4:76-609(+)